MTTTMAKGRAPALNSKGTAWCLFSAAVVATVLFSDPVTGAGASNSASLARAKAAAAQQANKGTKPKFQTKQPTERPLNTKRRLRTAPFDYASTLGTGDNTAKGKPVSQQVVLTLKTKKDADTLVKNFQQKRTSAIPAVLRKYKLLRQTKSDARRVVLRIPANATVAAAVKEITAAKVKTISKVKQDGIRTPATIVQSTKIVHNPPPKKGSGKQLPKSKPIFSSYNYDDPLVYRQWAITQSRASNVWADFNITGSKDIKVCVIDNGLDWTHPDIAPNVDANNPGYNAIEGTYDPSPDFNDGAPLDERSHGTFVASVIGAAGDNGIGTVGISPQVTLIGCKFMEWHEYYGYVGHTSAELDCIDYCGQQKANVVVGAYTNSWEWEDEGVRDYIKYWSSAPSTFKQGVLFVFAAGNDATLQTAKYPMFYPGGYAASIPNVISVASLGAGGNLSWFSNYGPEVVSGAAIGEAVWGAAAGGGYLQTTGTSAAAAVVAGAAALVWSLDPTRANGDVADALATGTRAFLRDTRLVKYGQLDAYRAAAAFNYGALFSEGGCGQYSSSYQQKVMSAIASSLKGKLPKNWRKDGKNYPTWDGVRTDKDDNVLGIDLTGRSFSGKLPDYFTLLPCLGSLALGNNVFSGSLPKAWFPGNDWVEFDDDEFNAYFWSNGPLRVLESLDLSNNRIIGSIPAYNEYNPSSVVGLFLSNNGLSGSLDSLWFPYLQKLTLDNNFLSGTFPATWFNSENSDLPTWPAFSQLREFNVSSNYNLQGSLPDASDVDLPNLLYLSLFNTRVQGSLPDSWAMSAFSKTLQGLYLEGVYLTSTLPASWGPAFEELVDLRITDTTLTGSLPPEWFNNKAFPKLARLFLVNLPTLEGSLPATLGEDEGLPLLKELHISGTGVEGHLPSTWADSPVLAFGLFELDLRRNKLDGPLPESWASATFFNLQFLNLRSNYLTGTLPASWGNSSMFIHDNGIQLYLFDNEIVGTIPAAWGEFASEDTVGLSKVAVLRLDSNKLTGTLPSSWGLGYNGNLYYLSELWVHGNRLSGEFPQSWFQTAGGRDDRYNPLWSLNIVNIKPGNDGVCGILPTSGWFRFYVTGLDEKGQPQPLLNLRACPGEQQPPASSSRSPPPPPKSSPPPATSPTPAAAPPSFRPPAPKPPTLP